MFGKISAHPTPDELQAYLAGRLPIRRNREVDKHVSACRHCADLLNHDRLVTLSTSHVASLPRRTIDYQEILRAALVIAAKRAVRSPMKTRLIAWEDRPTALAGGVFLWRPSSHSPSSAAQPAVQWITTFTGSSGWNIAPAREAPKSSATPPTSTSAVTGPTASLEATGPRELSVQISRWLPDAVAPLVLFSRELGLEPPVVKQSRRTPNSKSPAVRLDNLIPGRYLVGLEPVPASLDPG